MKVNFIGAAMSTSWWAHVTETGKSRHLPELRQTQDDLLNQTSVLLDDPRLGDLAKRSAEVGRLTVSA
jgi:hypothetical protein